MNKARRHELKMLHFKKRMKKYGFSGNEANSKFYSLRSHGKPCSCFMCKNEKYRNTERKKRLKIDLDDYKKN